MKKQKKYFKSPYLKGNEEYLHNEFSKKVPLDGLFEGDKNLSSTATSRRDFLKFLGFSTAAAVLSSCEAPVRKSIPYLNKPEEIIPGNPNYYASSCFEENIFSSLLVKTREGRPISLKSNDKYSFHQGGLNSRTYASVLSLYDSSRLKKAKDKNGNVLNNLDKKVIDKLSLINNQGKQIVLVSPTVISPTTKKTIALLSKKYNNLNVVYCDPISKSGMLNANKDCFGESFIPTYHFEKSNVIVSFGADFLAEWLDSGHAKQYSQKRNPGRGMSKHYQFESLLSLTGSNADKRVPLNPDENLKCILYLLGEIQELGGYEKSVNLELDKHQDLLKNIASELWSNKGKSLVISGSNNESEQVIINKINYLLGNYEKTINTSIKSNLFSSFDSDLEKLYKDVSAGKVGAIITNDYNLAYYHPEFKELLESNKINFKLAICQYMDETASLMDYMIPKSHYLESWGDFNPYTGVYTLQQPTINPLFSTRQSEEMFLAWSGLNISYYDYLKKSYESENNIKWNTALRDGVLFENQSAKKYKFSIKRNSIQKNVDNCIKLLNDKKDFLCLYTKPSMGTGLQSNNPWLQELPDPISKTTWDNYLTVSPSYAKELDLKNWLVADGALNGDVVDLTFNQKVYRLPVYVQPGQAHGTFGVSFGYGRTKAGKVGNNIGINAFKLYENNQLVQKGNFSVNKVSDLEHEFACTQVSHTMMGRKIVKETTLGEYLKDPEAGNEAMKFASYKGDVSPSELNLYEEHTPSMHLWNMSIDLNKCNGCGACIIACHAENNVPVVGKQEIRNNRDMHWLRLDRYYSSDMNKDLAAEQNTGAIEMYAEMEVPSSAENLEVVFQPVMCQHCNQAPCENVCPVAATTHSNEGLNQMTYNRCIGTRYCLNNCPYKVRRFNWFNYKDNDDFDYHMNDDLGKMVLNPDVTVRARGVMEKCSMCVQNIQKAKLDAKKEGRKVRDGEVNIACETACDTGAIVFGDMLDKSSRVVKEKEDPRSYVLLEEYNTKPSVFYKTKVRNKKI